MFTFFNLSEYGREQTEQELTKILFKPGGFQQYIDIELIVQPDGDTIQESHLIIDRTFVGGPENINPFAKDIAKSFIHDIRPATEQTSASRLVNAIWYLEDTEEKVIQLHPPPDLVIDSDTQTLIEVYVGIRSCTTFLRVTDSVCE